MNHERRFSTEYRAEGRGLKGYAALFNVTADIGGMFTETIRPGAFAPSLDARADILALVDHNPGQVLARTRSGTLRLTQDAKGLAFDLDVPETQAGRDVLELARRGDLGGMSFGFSVIAEDRKGDRRELRSVTLHEISVVSAWPAYDGTEVQARSLAANVGNTARSRLIKLWEAGA